MALDRSVPLTRAKSGATRIGRQRLAVMSSIARDARLKAAECEKQAAAARDPEIRLHYTQLARDCWDMAQQADQLEADLRLLRSKRLQANIIIGQELRAYYRACTTEEPRHDCSRFLRS